MHKDLVLSTLIGVLDSLAAQGSHPVPHQADGAGARHLQAGLVVHIKSMFRRVLFDFSRVFFHILYISGIFKTDMSGQDICDDLLHMMSLGIFQAYRRHTSPTCADFVQSPLAGL